MKFGCMQLVQALLVVLVASASVVGAQPSIPATTQLNLVPNVNEGCPLPTVPYTPEEFSVDKLFTVLGPLAAQSGSGCAAAVPNMTVCVSDGSVALKEGCCSIACSEAMQRTLLLAGPSCYEQFEDVMCTNPVLVANGLAGPMFNAARRCMGLNPSCSSQAQPAAASSSIFDVSAAPARELTAAEAMGDEVLDTPSSTSPAGTSLAPSPASSSPPDSPVHLPPPPAPAPPGPDNNNTMAVASGTNNTNSTSDSNLISRSSRSIDAQPSPSPSPPGSPPPASNSNIPPSPALEPAASQPASTPADNPSQTAGTPGDKVLSLRTDVPSPLSAINLSAPDSSSLVPGSNASEVDLATLAEIEQAASQSAASQRQLMIWGRSRRRV